MWILEQEVKNAPTPVRMYIKNISAGGISENGLYWTSGIEDHYSILYKKGGFWAVINIFLT